MCEFIADLEDEARWETSFERTHDKLIESALKAKQELSESKSSPMNYKQV